MSCFEHFSLNPVFWNEIFLTLTVLIKRKLMIFFWPYLLLFACLWASTKRLRLKLPSLKNSWNLNAETPFLVAVGCLQLHDVHYPLHSCWARLVIDPLLTDSNQQLQCTKVHKMHLDLEKDIAGIKALFPRRVVSVIFPIYHQYNTS